MTAKAMERQLEALKADMEDLDTTTTPTPGKETKKMAAKKTVAKKAPAKKVASKATAAPAKAKKANGADDGAIKLKDLAKAAKLEPHIARRQLRKAGVPNEGRWTWKDGSSELRKAREALGLS